MLPEMHVVSNQYKLIHDIVYTIKFSNFFFASSFSFAFATTLFVLHSGDINSMLAWHSLLVVIIIAMTFPVDFNGIILETQYICASIWIIIVSQCLTAVYSIQKCIGIPLLIFLLHLDPCHDLYPCLKLSRWLQDINHNHDTGIKCIMQY